VTVEATVREYYAALRAGEPLAPYFAERDTLVKFGVSERLTGYEAVVDGLGEQTRTTEDWTVESSRLIADRRGDVGWFTDGVRLAWTAESGERHDFDTRWSGTLERRDDEWRFVTMHVSTDREF